jgi:hypothetical protein
MDRQDIDQGKSLINFEDTHGRADGAVATH